MTFLVEHVPLAVRILVRLCFAPTFSLTELLLDISLQLPQLAVVHEVDGPNLGPSDGYLV